MSIKDIGAKIIDYLIKLAGEKFTGRLMFTLHFKDGGIGRTEVEIKHDLKP